MRILLVSANREHIPDPIFPLGLAYVAAAARQAHHEVAVADLCFGRRPLETLRRTIRTFRPAAIGLSLRNVDNAAWPRTTDYLGWHRQVVATVRHSCNAAVILGGSGYSILPDEYLQALGGDWGIRGEAEGDFVSLLASLDGGLDPGPLPGLVRRDADRSTAPCPVTLQRPLSRHWDDGLWPDRQLFDYGRYIRRGGTGNLQTKRGCVFRCNYCTYPLLEGNRFRSRPAADVVDEIGALQRDYGPHPLFFVDAILNFPRGHVEAICEEILHRGLRLRWSCYATPVKLDRRQARLMARAGCEGVELGSDAADDAQLQRLDKSFGADAVIEANAHCLEAGLRVCHTLIFGAPGETRASIRNTCRVMRQIRPTAVVAMTGVRLYPGTPLSDRLVAAGRIRGSDIGLRPTFYIEPDIAGFLPGHLQRQAAEAGNWVLPGLEPPLLPVSQRVLRGLGISGPLWRLLRYPAMRRISRIKFRRPDTSWGIPNPRRIER